MECLDNKGVSGALLTDLSKAFDCNSLQMLQSYLWNRKQRTKINDAYIKYYEILFGVTQGYILGSLLVDIFTCDMFNDINDYNIASYADDNTPYASSSNLDALISKLDETTNGQFQWFRNNHMKEGKHKTTHYGIQSFKFLGHKIFARI